MVLMVMMIKLLKMMTLIDDVAKIRLLGNCPGLGGKVSVTRGGSLCQYQSSSRQE